MRLEKGKLYRLDGRPWRCVLVNEYRAKLSPAWREERIIAQRDGSERRFFATPRPLFVSPHSALEEWSP